MRERALRLRNDDGNPLRTLVNGWSVPVRLAVGFGTAALALGAIAVSSTVMFSHVSTTTAASNHTRELAALAAEAKFAAADWNGWQTAYALDANLDRDMDADGGSHRSFVTATNTLDDLLTRLSQADGLTADESAQVAAARTAFTDFMQTDQTVYAAFGQGTPDAVAQANGLVLGVEIENYDKVAAATSAVAASLDGRSASTVASAADTGRRVAVGVALAAFVLLAGVGWVVTRSITRPLTTVVHALEAVARGDLSTRVELHLRRRARPPGDLPQRLGRGRGGRSSRPWRPRRTRWRPPARSCRRRRRRSRRRRRRPARSPRWCRVRPTRSPAASPPWRRVRRR